jgi:hypothetical protein
VVGLLELGLDGKVRHCEEFLVGLLLIVDERSRHCLLALNGYIKDGKSKW